MKIDMAPILSGKTQVLGIDYPLTVDHEIPGVTFEGAVRVHGEIRDMAGYISLAFRADAVYDTCCDRCLLPIQRTLTIDFQKTVAQENTLQGEDSDDYVVIESGMLEIDPLLQEALFLEFPTKHLCKDACKGLCPQCGKDLNEGACSCKEEKSDPKWDAIRAKLSAGSDT